MFRSRIRYPASQIHNGMFSKYFNNYILLFNQTIGIYKSSAIPKWNTSGVKSASKTDDHNLWPVFDKFSHSACELQRFSISIFCGQFPPHLAMNLLPVTLLSSQAVSSSSSFYITEDFQPSQNIIEKPWVHMSFPRIRYTFMHYFSYKIGTF